MLNSTLILCSIIPEGEKEEISINNNNINDDIAIILEQNYHYRYYLIVINQIGSVKSAPIEIGSETTVTGNYCIIDVHVM